MEGTHDQPANSVRPHQPFNGVFSSQTGLGGPLVAKEVEELEVPEGIDGGSGVGLVLHDDQARGKGEGRRKER